MSARNRKKRGALPNVGAVTSSRSGDTSSPKRSEGKAEGGAYVPPKRQNRQGVMFYLPKDFHKKFKIWALEDETTMQQIFEDLAKEYAKRRGVDPAPFFTDE